MKSIFKGLPISKSALSVLLFLFAAVSFFSCTKEVEFNSKHVDPKLVLNAFVYNGEYISFTVSKSVFFLDYLYDASTPDGVNAKLKVNGVEVGGLVVSDDTVYTGSYYEHKGEWDEFYFIRKKYTSNYKAQSNDKVEIIVSAPGYETVWSECVVLDDGLLIEANYTITDSFKNKAYSVNGDSDIFFLHYVIDLRVKITDLNPGQKDYYILDYNSSYEALGLETGWNAYVDSDDPLFGVTSSFIGEFDIVDIEGLDKFFIFDDKLFDGKSYTFRANVNIYGNFKKGEDLIDMDLNILRLDENLYKYYNTYSEEQDIWMTFLYEPIQTYTNVNNGYGITGSANSLSFNMKLKAYPISSN